MNNWLEKVEVVNYVLGRKLPDLTPDEIVRFIAKLRGGKTYLLDLVNDRSVDDVYRKAAADQFASYCSTGALDVETIDALLHNAKIRDETISMLHASFMKQSLLARDGEEELVGPHKSLDLALSFCPFFNVDLQREFVKCFPAFYPEKFYGFGSDADDQHTFNVMYEPFAKGSRFDEKIVNEIFQKLYDLVDHGLTLKTGDEKDLALEIKDALLSTIVSFVACDDSISSIWEHFGYDKPNGDINFRYLIPGGLSGVRFFEVSLAYTKVEMREVSAFNKHSPLMDGLLAILVDNRDEYGLDKTTAANVLSELIAEFPSQIKTIEPFGGGCYSLSRIAELLKKARKIVEDDISNADVLDEKISDVNKLLRASRREERQQSDEMRKRAALDKEFSGVTESTMETTAAKILWVLEECIKIPPQKA
jgi:hypothetical protein